MRNNHLFMAGASLIFGFALACLGAANPTHNRKLDTKTVEELKHFDSEELVPPGRRPVEKARRAETVYTNPTVVSLEWSCKLSATEITVGEPLTAEVTVKNPAERLPFRFSPPARGFLVGRLQVWIRQQGEKDFRLIDGLTRYPSKSPSAGLPVLLGPGEVRRWTSRLDHYAGVLRGSRREDSRLPYYRFYWLGGETFAKPAKYEVMLRYINTAVGNTRGEDERYEPIGVRLFGPYPVTVNDRPATDPKWVAELRRAWDVDRPPPSDSINMASDEMVSPFTRLSAKELKQAGPIGDDVRLWLLAREWSRNRDEPDSLRRYLTSLEEAVAHLRGNHPNRQAAEILDIAAKLDRGDETEALREALTSNNPDVQLLATDWLSMNLKKKK